MFRISFFVEDNHLAQVLHGIAGLVLDLDFAPVAGTNPKLQPEPTPTQTRRSKGGPVDKAMVRQQGGAAAMFVAGMRKRGLTEVNAAMARKICQDMGLSPTSYSHVLNTAAKAGLVKRGELMNVNGGQGFMWKLSKAALVDEGAS